MCTAICSTNQLIVGSSAVLRLKFRTGIGTPTECRREIRTRVSTPTKGCPEFRSEVCWPAECCLKFCTAARRGEDVVIEIIYSCQSIINYDQLLMFIENKPYF